MEADKSRQPVAPNTEHTPQVDTQLESDKRSLLAFLAATFYFGFPFFGLLTWEFLDKSYDGGGLGYLILFLFMLPPFLVLGTLSLIKAIKIRSRGGGIGIGFVAKCALFGLLGLVVTVAIIFVSKIWDSFF